MDSVSKAHVMDIRGDRECGCVIFDGKEVDRLLKYISEADKDISVLKGALERIAHRHDLHAKLLAKWRGQAWQAASSTLGWAQDIAKDALTAAKG